MHQINISENSVCSQLFSWLLIPSTALHSNVLHLQILKQMGKECICFKKKHFGEYNGSFFVINMFLPVAILTKVV